MNGLPRSDKGASGQTPATVEGQQLENLLRNTAGESKVIFGASRGTFDLDRPQIENFFHLIDQRICEQNNCGAKTCEFAVYYTDGSSRKFPDIASFNSYAETRPRYPTVITIHLSYFLTFPDSAAPERQEIDIVIRTSETVTETLDMVASDSHLRMSGDRIQIQVAQDDKQFGVITYTINHSRVSWGLDLEGHIKGHIDTIMQEPTKADKFLHRVSGPLNLFTTVFVGLYCVNLIIDWFFAFLYASDGAETPEEFLQTAAQYLINGHIAKYIVASIVVAFVFFVLFSALISRLTKSLRRPRPSFVVLDDNDQRRREEKLKVFNRRWSRFITTVSLDIIVAVAIFFLEERIANILAFFSQGS